MDALRQDLRYAARALWRAPGFALVAILTLALGIGANAAVFSLVNAVFLRPIPGVSAPDRLVRVTGMQPGSGGSGRPLTYAEFGELASLNGGPFQAVAAAGGVRATRGDGVPTELRAVSGGYFALLGVRPAVGRTLLPADDEPGAPPAAMVSHALWSRELGGDRGALGSTLRLNGRDFTVVGVAPRSFRGTDPEAGVEVWIPVRQAALLSADPRVGAALTGSGREWLFPLARMRAGVTVAGAAAALEPLAERLRADRESVPEGFRLRVIPGGTLVSPAGSPQVAAVFTLLMVVVGAVLCVACANVANLLLARGAARRREIAVRLSLGAGRVRLVRQLLTESMLLALLGGVAGLGLARLAPLLFRRLELPSVLDYSLDLRMAGHAAAVTLLTGLLFGMAPALQVTRGAAAALREAAPAGARRSRLRASLAAVQIALCLALLVATGLLLRSLWTIQAVAVPYDASRIAVSFVDGAALRENGADPRAGMLRAMEALRATPGVEAVAVGGMIPMGDLRVEADFVAPGGARALAQMNAVSHDYFRVLEMDATAGRLFTPADRAGGAPVAVVSAAMAATLWPARSPIGQRLRVSGDRPRDVQVVGVVPDLVYARAAGEEPTVYLPWEQMEGGEGILHVRTRPGARGIEESVIAAAEEAGVQLFGVRTIAQLRADAAFPQRLTVSLLALFGGLALVLAMVGLSGVVAFGVAQRTREIGVRVALGARPRQVVALIVRQGMTMAGAGVAAGVCLALGLARLLRGMLFGVGATDPITFGAVTSLLLGVAALASWLPARRAARLEPMQALRAD